MTKRDELIRQFILSLNMRWANMAYTYYLKWVSQDELTDAILSIVKKELDILSITNNFIINHFETGNTLLKKDGAQSKQIVSHTFMFRDNEGDFVFTLNTEMVLLEEYNKTCMFEGAITIRD